MSRPETITSEYVRGFRAGESSALERAAQIALSYCRCPKDGKSPTPCMTYTAIADGIRALAPPAAARSAETARCHCIIGAVADSCVYATPDCPCECACHPEPSAPVAPSLLPRVLAELEAHRGMWSRGLAAELRRYIAEMEGK